MGKTKTAFVGDTTSEKEKSGDMAYREKKERQAAATATKEKESKPEKVRIAGLKGGQRIKAIEMEVLPTEEINKQGSKELIPEKTSKKHRQPKIRGKKYQEVKSRVDKVKLYSLPEAVKLVKETSYSKFDGTVELHLVVKKAGISANAALPFSAGRQRKVEFATDETIKKIQAGKIDFDVLLATAEMMPKLVPFARVLGPKGLMPNPKNGTLVKSEKDAKSFGGNTTTLKTEKELPLIHTKIGKVSQKEEEIVKNAEVIFSALGGTKQILKVFMKATMGPSVKVAI